VSAHQALVPEASSEDALDAYSRTVIEVAESLAPSVANLRVVRRTRRGDAEGGGSAVVIAPDGFLLTSAHVVERSGGVTASFADGRETRISVVGSDRLSDLALLRAEAGDLVVEVAGERVRSIGDLDRAVRGAASELNVRVLRGAEPRELSVRFDEAGSE